MVLTGLGRHPRRLAGGAIFQDCREYDFTNVNLAEELPLTGILQSAVLLLDPVALPFLVDKPRSPLRQTRIIRAALGYTMQRLDLTDIFI